MLAKFHEYNRYGFQLYHEGRLKHWSGSCRVCRTCSYTPWPLQFIVCLLGATQEWLYLFSSFNSASCYVRQSCTEPPNLIRSTNIVAITSLGPISKFNFRQCFWVYMRYNNFLQKSLVRLKCNIVPKGIIIIVLTCVSAHLWRKGITCKTFNGPWGSIIVNLFQG